MPSQKIVNLVAEECIDEFELSGHCHFYEGGDTGCYDDAAPSTIIQTDQPCYWALHFKQEGPACNLLAGTWHAQMYLEKMGQEEYELPPELREFEFEFQQGQGWRPVPPVPFWRIIPANTIPAGVYRAVATLLVKGPTGIPGPIAAFADIGLLQFYEEGA